MKTKSKVILFTILIISMSAYIVRVAFVNINFNTLSSEEITYKLDDEVPIENNYFNSSVENADGYTIKVLSTEFVSMDEFQAEHKDFVSDLFAENVLLVKVLVRNVDNTNGGINFGYYLIQEGSYISFLNRDAYPFVNKHDTLMFSIKPNTEMEFVLPFNIDSNYIDIEKLKSGTPTLVVSLYPHKKVIELK